MDKDIVNWLLNKHILSNHSISKKLEIHFQLTIGINI